MLRVPQKASRAVERLTAEQRRRWRDLLVERAAHPVAGTPPPVPRPGRPPKVVQASARLAAFTFFLERPAGAAYQAQLEWPTDRDGWYALTGAWGQDFGEFLGMPVVETTGTTLAFRGLGFAYLGKSAPSRLGMVNSQFGIAATPGPLDAPVTTSVDDDVELSYGALASGGRGFTWTASLSATTLPRRLYIVPARPARGTSDFASWVSSTTCVVELGKREGKYTGSCRPTAVTTDSAELSNLYVGVIIEGDTPADPLSDWRPRSAGAWARATP